MSHPFGPVEALDRYLNRHILSAPAGDVRRWWAVKVRAKRLLEHARDPAGLATRMLRVLRAHERQVRDTPAIARAS